MHEQRRIALQRTAPVRAHPHQMRHALRMAADVFDRDRAALRHAEERKAGQVERVDDGLDIAHPDVEREVADGAVGQTRAALIEAHMRVIARQLAQPRLPDGALEVVLDVAQPVRRTHERRASADRRHRDPGAVGGGAEADVLPRGHARLSRGHGAKHCTNRAAARGSVRGDAFRNRDSGRNEVCLHPEARPKGSPHVRQTADTPGADRGAD